MHGRIAVGGWPGAGGWVGGPGNRGQREISVAAGEAKPDRLASSRRSSARAPFQRPLPLWPRPPGVRARPDPARRRAQITSGFDSDKERLKATVANMPYDAGSTATGPGIWAAVQMIQDYGRDPATPRVLVLFTDGASNTGESVVSVMARLAEPLEGITRYAVGIGASINEAELLLFAGDAARVYSIDDYSSLSDIAGAITHSSCNSNANLAVGAPVAFQMPAGAARTFSTPVPDGGVTVRVTVSNASALGSADVYYSTTVSLPSKDLSDGRAVRVDDTTLAFAVARTPAERRAAAAAGNAMGPTVLYYTIESKEELGQVQVLPSRGSERLAPCGAGCTACDLNGQSCTACGAGVEIVRGGCAAAPVASSSTSGPGQTNETVALMGTTSRGAACGAGCTACDLDGQNCTACNTGLEFVRGECVQGAPPASGGGGEKGGLGLAGVIALATALPLSALALSAACAWLFLCRQPQAVPADANGPPAEMSSRGQTQVWGPERPPAAEPPTSVLHVPPVGEEPAAQWPSIYPSLPYV